MRSGYVGRRLVPLLAGMLLAACSGAASSGGAPAPTAPAGTSNAASASAASSAIATAPAPRQHLRISYGATVGVHVPIVAANRLGEWEQEGLDVDVQRIATASSISALLAGELDLVQVSAPALVSANVAGADLVFVAGALDRFIIGMWAMPDIRSADDLRGKAVGSDRPGTPVAYATGLALSRLGLTLNDVQVLPVGSEGMVPGMESGQLQTGSMTLPDSLVARRFGAHLLVPLYDQPYQNIGLIMRRGDMDRLAPALPGLLRVYRHAIERYLQDPRWGKEALAALLDSADDELLQETYDFFAKTVPFTPSLRVSREGLQAVVDSLKDTLPGAAAANVDSFYDHRFVDQLDRER
ncbi:MAG TPA: ABC transporter substrate-binding protein [Chloroflexota bacterium]|nr:ABC transporter substrate-binding protein [Chloroflexota bacterium]